MARQLRWAVNTSSWVPSEQEWLHALAVLQPEEVDRVGQFVFQRDAKFALVGRLLIWAGLGEHMGGFTKLRGDHGYRFGRSKRGKPMLLDVDGCEVAGVGFNVSHQGDYVVLATEKGKQVGVDLMQLSQPRNTSLQEFFRLMKRQFTEKEWLQITPSYPTSTTQQLNNFYRFWCLKESFIKAEGSGLSYGLQNLEFVCGAGSDASFLQSYCVQSQLSIRGKQASDWQFQEYMLDSEHCVAVAVQRHTTTGSPEHLGDEMVLSFSLVTVPWLLTKLQLDCAHHHSTEMDCAAHHNAETHWKHFKQKQLKPKN